MTLLRHLKARALAWLDWLTDDPHDSGYQSKR